MGKVEAQMKSSYSEISKRLKGPPPVTSLPPPKPVYIKIGDGSNQLQAQVDYLRGELIKAEEIIRKLSINNPSSIKKILTTVAFNEGVTKNEIISPRRNKNICLARHIIFYLCCLLTDLGLPQIGRAIGARDHTTVIHGRDKITRLRLTDRALDEKLSMYERVLMYPVDTGDK